MGDPWFGTEAEVEVEIGRAMFFRAFLPRFLVILKGDLKKRATRL